MLGNVYFFMHMYILSIDFIQSGSGTLSPTSLFVLEPPNGGVAYGRFGHAIEPLGDLNNDGFQGTF